MSGVSASVIVEAAPKEVWDVVSNPRNLPRWDRRVTKVMGVPPGGLAEGDEYSTVMSFMGVRAHVDAEVLELRPPEYSRIRLSGPVVDAIVTTRITEIEERRSRLEHDVEYHMRGGPLGRLAAKALGVTGGPGYLLRRGTLAQKQQIEEG